MTCSLVQLMASFTPELIIMANQDFADWLTCDATKCLNSGILISTLLLGGRHKSSQIIGACENDKVNQQSPQQTVEQVERFARSILHAPNDGIYYAILSDAVLQPGNVYFPGHIFVIEVAGGIRTLVQSYVGEYDLASSRSCRELDGKGTSELLELLRLLCGNPGATWTPRAAILFRRLTSVSAGQFVGQRHAGQFKVCISTALDGPAKNAVAVLRDWRHTLAKHYRMGDVLSCKHDDGKRPLLSRSVVRLGVRLAHLESAIRRAFLSRAKKISTARKPTHAMNLAHTTRPGACSSGSSRSNRENVVAATRATTSTS